MKYKVGQKVRIKRRISHFEMHLAASKLNPPHVATISMIIRDPHSGQDMYRFEECMYGWLEQEVEGLYDKPIPIKDRFEILDL